MDAVKFDIVGRFRCFSDTCTLFSQTVTFATILLLCSSLAINKTCCLIRVGRLFRSCWKAACRCQAFLRHIVCGAV